jgi:hypothetical protein
MVDRCRWRGGLDGGWRRGFGMGWMGQWGSGIVLCVEMRI